MCDRGGGGFKIALNKWDIIFERPITANAALNKHSKTCFMYFVIEYHSLLLRRV